MIKILRKTFFVNYSFIANLSQQLAQVCSFQQLRNNIRTFSKKVIQPLASQVDLKNQFPLHLWKLLGQQGLLGITVPTQYGGPGFQHKYTANCIAMQQISRASGSIGLSYGACSALCIGQIQRHANKKQKQKYLPKLCSGEYVGALSMSESNAGSDVISMKTKAVKKGDHWIINGTKMWCTNGVEANVIVLYAKTDVQNNKITAFLIEKGMKGFYTAQKLDKLGMRGSNTCQLILQDVQVPEQNVLGEVNKGVYVLMSGLDYQRLILAAGPVGIMQSTIDVVIPYIKTREQFGQKIGEFQLMQGKIAQMYTKLQSSRAMLYSVARSVDEGLISNIDCASVIYYTSKCGTQVALQGIQALGGNGYMNSFSCGRFLRDAKLYEIGAGTQQIRLWLIGRQLFNSEDNN